MSIRVMTDVWRYSRARGTDLLVLLALADSANDEGECWPSIASVGSKSRLEPRNARKRIRALEELGEVVVIENGGRSSNKGGLRSNRYRITVHMPADTDDSVPIVVPKIGTDASVSEAQIRTLASDPIWTLASDPIRTLASPESSGDSSGEPPSLAPPSAALVTRVLDELFDSVAEACGINAAELTTSARGAMNRALKDLRSVGAEPDDVPRRAAIYRRTYPRNTLTPAALAKHWPQLNGGAPDSPQARAFAVARQAGR